MIVPKVVAIKSGGLQLGGFSLVVEFHLGRFAINETSRSILNTHLSLEGYTYPESEGGSGGCHSMSP